MGLRRRSREIALQILFQKEFSKHLDSQSLIDLYESQFELKPDLKDYTVSLVSGVSEYHRELDRIIQAHSHNWKINRMAFVDRNILRLAVYELKYMAPPIPFQVVIDEAVEIGKRYGSLESSQFINGVLDQIAKTSA